MTAEPRIRSLDDPSIFVEQPRDHHRRGAAVPAADRARGGVLLPPGRRDVRQPGSPAPVDPRRAARRASRSTASRSWTSIRCSATSTAAWRRSARTATGTTPSATATRWSTSPRCSRRRCRCWSRRSCSTSRCPRRAEYIRVLAWELNRISSHALFIGWLALDLGGLTPILYGFIERDEIVEMLAALTGQKLLFNYLRIGGVNGDLNHEFLSRLGDWMSHAGQAHRGSSRSSSTRTRSSSAGRAAWAC